MSIAARNTRRRKSLDHARIYRLTSGKREPEFSIQPTDGPEEKALAIVGALQGFGGGGPRTQYAFRWWDGRRGEVASIYYELHGPNGVIDSELVAHWWVDQSPMRVEAASEDYCVHKRLFDYLLDTFGALIALTISDDGITCADCWGEGYTIDGYAQTGSGFGDAHEREVGCEPCGGSGRVQ